MDYKKIISFIIYMIFFFLLTCGKSIAQERIPVERSILEYLYEQKKENDHRKVIIIEQDSVIQSYNTKIFNLEESINTYKNDSLSYLAIKQSDQKVINKLIVTNKETNRMLRRFKDYTKITSTSTIILILTLLILL